ncbi:MAG: ATP-binding protein, partial [Bacteroidota bacterium]
YEDSQGRLWVSTVNQGLNLYREESNDFQRWNENGLLFPRPVIEGKEGNVWIGSISGEGLYKINPETEELSYFNKQNGLASENVYSIALDKGGDLWLPSESGLTRFDPQTETSTTFDKDDGFGSLANEGEQFFFQPVISENGDIWFHSITRLYRIQPDKLLTKDPTLPRVLISGLTIGDEHIETADHFLLKDHISRTNSLTLAHDQNELTFEFVGLHFAHAEDNLYSYKLEGVDEDWTTPSIDRRARYPNLPPGSYIFKVRASNADGLWNEEGTTLKITISRAWWETPFAYAVYLALFGLGIWYFVKWRTRKQEEKIRQGEEDLAKERQLTEQLTSLDRLKDQFIANTSHELRTPLNGIMGLSEGIFDRTTDTTDKEDLSLIISSSRRLHSLVDDLLDFSKLKNAEFEIQKVPTDLLSVVDLVLRMSEPSARKNKVSLSKTIPASLPSVSADPQRLQQIFYNLLGNAIKFTKEGEVKVLAEVVAEKVKISISDTGIGIPEDKQKVIFEEFQQADGSTARQFGGTGLGLSITKQLVNLHGGEIGVESKVGEGSTFWFTLEVSEEEGISIMSTEDQKSFVSVAVGGSLQDSEVEKALENTPSSVTTVPLAISGTHKLRILIVDDEPVNQRVMKSHLGDSHFFLAFADDGPAALKIIGDSPRFDLVLLDVMMPNMSGYEVCKQLREQYLPSELPVIMVTAKNQVDDLVQGLKEGANDYLAKPFSKQELLARIKTQLDLNHIFNIAGRFIPNEFIRTLGHERLTDVQLGDLVEREVSVLFTDIRNYTTLSESMSPEDNFYFINGYTNRMGPIIKKYRGFVNQYLGDGIMAIFQHGADDALKAMIGMQAKLREYNQERRQKNRPEIAVGMGLHSGPLIMGIIGDTQRTDAATISDTVNTAARMEGLSKVFGARVLISGDSYKDLKHPEDFRFRYLGKVKVKGKNEEVDVYECIEGDSVEEGDLKWQLKDKFDLLTQYYYQNQFELAIDSAKELLESNPTDKATQFFYHKMVEK